MAEQPQRTRVLRGVTESLHWELATRPPIAALASCVRELQGYVERGSGAVRRREFPGLQVVVILEFEPRLRVFEPGQYTRHASYAGGFVAGVDDAFTVTEYSGSQAGIQLNLHPLGARRLFGLPLRELRGHVVHFRDLLPASQRSLSERLAELDSWDARFDLLEVFLLERLGDAKPGDAQTASRTVQWALQRIAQSEGVIDIQRLTRELGYSHKHVVALFHDQVGVTPKLWARLVRFDRLRRELARGTQGTWAELALTCGYYDQAHLARDVRQFTGAPPGELLRPAPGLELEVAAR
jgi:AraC-like DNA-binding protein